jgi:hemolysin activation/secretion protein
MDAHEGRLNHIRLHGNQYLRNNYLSARLSNDLAGPFNINDLEQSLRLLQEHPLIEQVNAEVLPGGSRGESILDLKVREKRPRTLTIGFDNHRAPSVGEYEGTAVLSTQSFTGNGDYVNVSYALADGLDDLYVGYGLPLTARDLTFEGYWSQGESDIVEQPFDDLDIVSETDTWGMKLFQPLRRTLEHTFVLGVTFENKQTQSYLLDQAFSFSPGEQVGESEVSALRLAADWTWRREKDAIALRGTLSQGMHWLGATDNGDAVINGVPVDDLPDSEFTTLLVQAQYARRLPWWHQQLVARLSGQATSDPLLSVEKLAVGGARTVRGYRENQLVRDQGLIASIELRQPLFMDDNGASRIGLSFAPFVDYGWAKDKSIGLPGLDDPDSDELFSAGAGLIWNWWEPLYMEAYYGADLKDAPGGESEESSLQEDGFHVQVSLSWDF